MPPLELINARMMRCGLFCAALLSPALFTANGQAAPTAIEFAPGTIGNDHTENFNTLLGTAGPHALPIALGWAASLPNTYVGDNGTDADPGIYSYGRTAQVDRALGSLATVGPLVFGALFHNDTGVDITHLDIQFIGEQWRQGSSALESTLFFEYRLTDGVDNDEVTDGVWDPIGDLDYVSPHLGDGGDPVILNANLYVNRTYHATKVPITIPNGTSFWIRFRNEAEEDSGDHGLAIDDFQITPLAEVVVPEPSAFALMGFGLVALIVWKKGLI